MAMDQSGDTDVEVCGRLEDDFPGQPNFFEVSSKGILWFEDDESGRGCPQQPRVSLMSVKKP